MKFEKFNSPNICEGCNKEFYGNSYNYKDHIILCKVCDVVYDKIKLPDHISIRQNFTYKKLKLKKLLEDFDYKIEKIKSPWGVTRRLIKRIR